MKTNDTPVFAAALGRGKTKWLTCLLILAAVLVTFFPIFWLIETAFKHQVDFLSVPPKILFLPTLKNFRSVLAQSDFALAYQNSTVISIFAVVLSTLLGVPAAYGLSRFRFPARGLLSFWILSTRFIPPVVVVIPFFLIFRVLGLANTISGMVLIYMVASLPLVIWIMVGFFDDIPFELEEAACVDGASPITTFTRIAAPLIAPGVIATVILALIGSWNELLYATVLTGPDTRTLPVAIYNFVSYQEIAWGNLCAAGVLAIAPIMAFTIAIQKYLVSGLTFGAVK